MRTLTSLLTLALLAATLSISARTSSAKVEISGSVVMGESSEMVHVEKLFSGAHWTHPAPTTWSSRLEIRWNARWDGSPQFAA